MAAAQHSTAVISCARRIGCMPGVFLCSQDNGAVYMLTRYIGYVSYALENFQLAKLDLMRWVTVQGTQDHHRWIRNCVGLTALLQTIFFVYSTSLVFPSMNFHSCAPYSYHAMT
jgi:hypothetical protein